jgi:hypothetical protein
LATITGTVNQVSRSGIADGAGDAVTSADTYKFANDGMTALRIANASGSTTVVTPVTPVTLGADALTVQDGPTVSVNNGVTKWAGPYPTGIYNDASGLVSITVDHTVTITAFRVVPA